MTLGKTEQPKPQAKDKTDTAPKWCAQENDIELIESKIKCAMKV